MLLILFCILFSKLIAVFGTDEDIDGLRIIKTEMTDQMQDHIVTAALAYFEYEKDMDISIIAKKLSIMMDKKYGHTWECLTATKSNLTIKTEHEQGTYLLFSYKDNQFLVFKLRIIYTIDDVLNDTKRNPNNISRVENLFSDSMKNSIISIVQKEIVKQNNTDILAKIIGQILNDQYKNAWICSIGTLNDAEVLKRFSLLFRLLDKRRVPLRRLLSTRSLILVA
jgi:hypothetical protein